MVEQAIGRQRQAGQSGSEEVNRHGKSRCVGTSHVTWEVMVGAFARGCHKTNRATLRLVEHTLGDA